MTNTPNLLLEISRVVLMATDQYVVMSILLIGFIFLRKESFGRAFYVLAFTMILNPFLKSLFEVPLLPAVGHEGWAFPSGHMQTCCAMWMCLAWEYKNKKFNIAVMILLSAIGFALVRLGYHTSADVIVAAVFAALTVWAFNVCLRKFSWTRQYPKKLGLAIAVVCIPMIILTPESRELLGIWLSFGGLIGFALGWAMSNKEKFQLSEKTFKSKLPIFLVAMLGMYGITYMFDNLGREFSPIILTIQYLLIALWLTGISQYLIARIAKAKDSYSK